MKITEMVIICLSTSYIVGIFWFFICSLNEEFYQDDLFINMSEE